MKQRRWKLSSAQRADMWNRWKAGQSLNAIGRALGKDHVVIRFLLARHGGIAPPARRRSRRVLSLAEREDISRRIASGCSMRVIAQGLSRALSTVSREIARHGGRAQYRANEADQQAWASALRPRPCLLATHSKLQEIVAGKLMPDWSPQEISGWLKQHYPDDKGMRVSHETIYRSLFIQARGALKQELVRHLRSRRRIRRSRHASVHAHFPRPDRGCCLHPRKTCGSRRSCHSRTLGGRSVARGAQQSRSHSGGASFAFLHAGEGARQRHRHGGGRPEPARAPTPSDAASLANLGPRAGDGRAQKLHDGYGCAGLLLRSTKSLAARIERKHERAIAANICRRRRT